MSDDFIPQIKPDEIAPPVNMEDKPVLNNEAHAEAEGVTSKPLLNPILTRGQTTSFKMKIKPRFGFPTNKKKLLPVAGAILLIVIINIVLLFNFALKSIKVVSQAKKIKDTFTSQDFNKVRVGLKEVDESLSSLKGAYTLISWMRIYPFFGGYVSDAGHVINAGKSGIGVAELLVDASEPYADLLGFTANATQQDGQKTAADRIDFIVKTIPDILPKLDEIGKKMDVVEKEIVQVNSNHYPVVFAGKKVRENVEVGISLVKQSSEIIRNGKPLLEQTPYLLGLESPRTYLVLFQNDKELRPTGGFLTAYSIMKVDKAKFEPVDSSDIYNVDAKYKPSIPAPQPIIKYLKGPYVLDKNFRLRDINWYPDFSESMRTFLTEAEKVGISEVDGVIAVDTQVLVNLLEVLGPIGVSGFGNYSTDIVPECNCPQVIYELESFADVEGPVVWDPAGTGKIIYAPANYDNRKKIIGPLMNSILANAFGQPKEKLAKLFEAGYRSLVEKHVLLYLLDEKPQEAVKGFGVAGTIKDYSGDYFYLNDANLGGRKSNLYITQEVVQDIKVLKDGFVEKTVEITYKNPEKYDGWLNSVLPNWVRIYVPKGSELISFEGVTDKEDPYEESGKTVFAGYFELRPLGVVKVSLKYKLPFKVKNTYDMYVQKQPGTDRFLYSVTLGKNQEEFLLNTDKEFKFKI